MEKIREKYEKEKTMTLFKQMAILLSSIIIIMLAWVMVINYQSAKKDMIESLYQNSVNNISSLADKLAQSAGDREVVISIIDSEFDSGYYRKISFKSNNSLSDYEQVDKEAIESVPPLFVKFTNIELESINEDVMSNDFIMIGSLSVEGDIEVVYSSLYKMFIKLLYLFVIFVISSLIILSVLLHFVLKPLKKVQNQAEAILKNEFIIQENIPYTTEFRDVVKGMNAMVQKVEEIFKKANEAAQRNRELLYNDPITKLFNRRYLMLKLPNVIQEENRANGGSSIFIRLHGAEFINRDLGRQKADTLFLKLAETFNRLSREYENRVLARVNGTEFMLILPNCEAAEAEKIADAINSNFSKLLSLNMLNETEIYLSQGVYRYKQNSSVSELLTKSDSALCEASTKDERKISLYEERADENALGKEQWREIIQNAIDNRHFTLKFYSTVNTQNRKLLHKVMTFIIDLPQKKQYYYGDFIAPAINLGFVTSMYIVTLKELLTNPHKELTGSICSIRLSNEFIKDKSSLKELSKLFKKYAKTLNFKLMFELSDSFAINHTKEIKEFVELFDKYGFGFGINSFTAESNDFNYLKELNPKFLKADCAFLLDQSKDSMSAIQTVTDSLGIEIIATFVKSNEEVKRLQEVYIKQVQGPITETIDL